MVGTRAGTELVDRRGTMDRGTRVVKKGSKLSLTEGEAQYQESDIDDDEIIRLLTERPEVHRDTPEDICPWPVSTGQEIKIREKASEAKTGDILLLDTVALDGHISKALQRWTKPEERGVRWSTIKGGGWTHAGIVIRVGSKVFCFESFMSGISPLDVLDGTDPRRLAGGIRIFPLHERCLWYTGDTYLLPIREPLSEAREAAFLKAAWSVWRHNSPFDFGQLVHNGIARLCCCVQPLKDFEAFFCSELVGYLLEEAGVIPPEVNSSNLSPTDLRNHPALRSVVGELRLLHAYDPSDNKNSNTPKPKTDQDSSRVLATQPVPVDRVEEALSTSAAPAAQKTCA